MVYLVAFLFAYFVVGAYVAGIVTVMCDDDGCSSRETLKYVASFVFLWLFLVGYELIEDSRYRTPKCDPTKCRESV